MERRTLRGIHFVRVKGSSLERVVASTRLLRSEMHEGVVPFLGYRNAALVRRGPGVVQSRAVHGPMLTVLQKVIMPYLVSHLSRDEKRTLRSLAMEVGIPYEVCRDALYQPDVMLLLARSSLFKHFLTEWIPGGVPGCTSAVVLKEWTKERKLLVCRNLDYPAVGTWEKHPTVLFNETTDPDEVPYVALTAAGIPFGGITAMNREGLTLSTHVHFGKTVSLRGNPILVVGDAIIRKAKTIGQAVDIARKSKLIANWSFIISSAKENEGVVLEMTPKKVHVRSTEEGFLSHTNFFHSEELRKEEALFSGGVYEDLKARHCRMGQLLRARRGNLEPSDLSRALGDHVDCTTGKERVFGYTVSVVNTVQSVVFEPESQRFWLACRDESPVCLGDYLEIDVERFWKDSAEEYEKSMPVLPHYEPMNPALVEAVSHFRKAYVEYHMGNSKPDLECHQKTLVHLRKALTLFPDDGHLWIQAGAVALKAQEFSESRRFLEASRSHVLTEHVRTVRDLHLARCLDLLGEREGALQIYRENYRIVNEPNLKKAYRRGLARPYSMREVKGMVLDLQFPDAIHY